MEILDSKTDIGRIRDKNEDAVLSINHPKNKNIKLLIVADGMGGKEKGEVASNYVTMYLHKWFIGKDLKTLNDNNKVINLLNKYIKTLNTNLIKKYGQDKLGTTLTLALVNKTNTLIFNVGDSRCYIYKEKKLIQVTEDDSDVWMYHKYGGVKKDYLRFFSNNNVITACIGICNELCKISTTVINNDYDMIFLLTDGVTDIITDAKIKTLIRKTPKEELLSSIINEAVNVDQNLKVPLSLKRKFTANYIVPFKGRDNASGVIYIK
ncbi:MAG: serine/threonine-protein phosphatase [Bacilli bacterium]|nr:serine/threonine-protein phosphatase [Bacilli bacterium]